MKRVLIVVAVLVALGYGIYLVNCTGQTTCGTSTCLNLHDTPGAQPQ